MEDEHGRFGFAVPDEEVNLCINQLTSSVGTYFWGRRMYEAMVCWETAHAVPNLLQFLRDCTQQWPAAGKIVTPEPSPSRAACERGTSPVA